MSAPTILSAQLLTHTTDPAPGRTTPAFMRTALARAMLLLLPVPLALVTADVITTLPPLVPIGAVVGGWAATQYLAHLGQLATYRGTPRAPVSRLVLLGFTVIAGVWSVLLGLAPAELVGPDRTLAYAVSLAVLGLLASIAVALATHRETALLWWSLPVLLIAAAALGGWLPVAAGPPVLAALVFPIGRAVLSTVEEQRTAAAGAANVPALRAVDLLRSGRYLALGMAQAALVVTVWQASNGALAPMVMLVIAVPAIEVWIGWHLARTVTNRTAFDDRNTYLRHLRTLGWATLAPLPPLLVAGVALASLAHRLPYALSTHPDAPAAVQSIAAGLMLPAVLGLGMLLAARGAAGTGALITAAPLAGALFTGAPRLPVASLSGWGPPLAATVIALAVGVAVGLVLTAHVLVDPRRRP